MFILLSSRSGIVTATNTVTAFSHKQMVKFSVNPCHLWMLQHGQMAADKVPSSRKWYKVVHIIATNRCFAPLSPAMTSSNPLSLHASSSDCGCRLELVTTMSMQGFLSPCHLYGDRGSGSRPQLVPTFHIYSASRGTILARPQWKHESENEARQTLKTGSTYSFLST